MLILVGPRLSHSLAAKQERWTLVLNEKHVKLGRQSEIEHLTAKDITTCQSTYTSFEEPTETAFLLLRRTVRDQFLSIIARCEVSSAIECKECASEREENREKQ